MGKNIREHRESPVLGLSKHRSEYTAIVDPLALDGSQQALENQRDEPSRYVDSGFLERRHTLGTLSSYALGQLMKYYIFLSGKSANWIYQKYSDQYRRKNFQQGDFASAQSRHESPSQGQDQSSTYQGNETLRPYTATSIALQSPISTGLLSAYHHDADIYHTHAPSVTHSIDTHVSYNPRMFFPSPETYTLFVDPLFLSHNPRTYYPSISRNPPRAYHTRHSHP